VYLYRLRSILRQRWTDYVLLTVLIAVVGGLAMGSVVAGRRTQSAYGAFLGRDDASTLTMSTYGLYNGSPANHYSPQVEQQIRRLPDVAGVESWIETYIAPLAASGAPNLAALSSIDVAGSVDGVFFHEDRVTVVRGRMADPTNPHEFMASESGARLLGIGLGQTVEFGRFDAQSASGPGFGTPEDRPSARFPLRLVAIVEFNNSVVQDDTDRTPTNLILTPALTRAEENYANGTWFAIRLKPGVKNLGQVEQVLLRTLPPGALGQFYLTSTIEAKVESALRPESIALGVFGLIAALAVLGLCLPIMGRLQLNGRDERRVMRALGAPRTTVAADFCVGIAASVLVGAVLASVVSAALGSFAPLGPVHTVYHPGALTVDWTVTGVGIVVLAGILCGTAVVMGVRSSAPRRAGEATSGAPAVSRAVDVAATAGLPAPVVVGARFALEQGQGRTSVAARSVLAGGILSVTLVVATLTFASGLRTLVNRPALYGWDWGYTLIGNSNVPPDALSALQRDPSVQAWAGYIAVTTTVDGRSVPVLIATNSLSVTPPLVAGHQISSTGQILLGRATLSALNKRVGDTVRVGLGGPGTAPLYLPPQPLKVVGVATFPAVAGSSNFADHTSMGIGGLFSFASLPQQFVSRLQNPDPVQNGPVLVFVRYRPGTSRAAALTDIHRIITVAARQFASDPQAGGASVSYLPVQRPAAIVNYQSTGSTPLILASGLAVAAIVALALSMVASVRRRRRDLAVLKTLGFVRRQMIAAVATQALVTGLLAAAIGVPLGVAAGRQLWIAFARSIYAVPEPTVPASVALVAAGSVLIAVAVALIPGRLAARTPAAVVLRAD
jgi:hypothetical protein